MLSCDWLLQIYMCKQFRKRQIVTDVAGLIIFKNRKVLYTVSTEVRHHRSQVDIIQFNKTCKTHEHQFSVHIQSQMSKLYASVPAWVT